LGEVAGIDPSQGVHKQLRASRRSHKNQE